MIEPKCDDCGNPLDWVHETTGGRLDCLIEQARRLVPAAGDAVEEWARAEYRAAIARGTRLGFPENGQE